MANITGTANSDTLTGTLGDDTIDGLAGNDTLNGQDGADVLNGGDGIGAPSIRWSGWALGLAVSAGVWAGILHLVGLL